MTLEPEFADLLRRHLHPMEDPAQLQPDTRLSALGLDSMRAVELLFDVEDTFDVHLPDDAMRPDTFATPQVLWQAIQAARTAS